MPLTIRDPQTEGLAGEVAALPGDSRTSTVRQAVGEHKTRPPIARPRQAHAAARVADRPLLARGGDFAKTDIDLA